MVRKPFLGFAVVMGVALVVATLASAKESAVARLTTNLPLSAKPGSTVRVQWTVETLDASGERRPFGASGMFVRLLSRSGAPPTTGYDDGSGRFETTIRVPEGGIGGVRAGLRGIRCGASGCQRSDAVFPLVNDPFASPEGVRCDAAALRSKLLTFVRAYNRGDVRQLDRLFSEEPGFKWYSWGGNARSNRDALTTSFKRRYVRGDRLRDLTFRFNGYDRQRDLGHYQFHAERKADDIGDGAWFSTTGKGALDCSRPPVTFALMFLGRPR